MNVIIGYRFKHSEENILIIKFSL